MLIILFLLLHKGWVGPLNLFSTTPQLTWKQLLLGLEGFIDPLLFFSLAPNQVQTPLLLQQQQFEQKLMENALTRRICNLRRDCWLRSPVVCIGSAKGMHLCTTISSQKWIQQAAAARGGDSMYTAAAVFYVVVVGILSTADPYPISVIYYSQKGFKSMANGHGQLITSNSFTVDTLGQTIICRYTTQYASRGIRSRVRQIWL